ncbi:MAG: radical SAM protein [Oscillospiraceae bacterium]|nr:radical SAM protein [Oscillospiraceae bacterium]MBR3536614.1 radical SAM protein [Oscillospiraceae bacterium]MBR6835157.1 radical SAM protein [Oscillospiraceae bacterium]
MGLIKMNDPSLVSCRLCPRECGADRTQRTGYCGAPAEVVAGRASLHMWEEPCISGESGSGTVFFSGCPLKCVYCQNYSISDCSSGVKITDSRLAEIFLELQEKGANNINLVTPTHYTLSVINAVAEARKNGLVLPVVYNCSGYEKADTIKLLDGTVDIYLTDFKYIRSETAKRYSNAADYPERAMEALECMFSQVGTPVFDDEEMMKRGIIVRHLILPDHAEESKEIIEYLFGRYRHDIFMSIMNQYTPVRVFKEYPELGRKVTDEEYDSVIDFAVELGVENAFIQDGEAASESFIPCFDGSGII